MTSQPFTPQRQHYGELERRVHLAQQQHQQHQQQRVRLADTMPDSKSVNRDENEYSLMASIARISWHHLIGSASDDRLYL